MGLRTPSVPSPHRLGGIVVLSLLSGVGSASASDDLRVVDVFVSAPAPLLTQLEGAVFVSDARVRWAPMARIDEADVLRGRASGAAPVSASVWIDGSRPNLVRLFFLNRHADRFLTRQVDVPRGIDETALETLAQVIQSSLAAMLLDARAGMSRAEMQPALGQDSVTPPPAPLSSEPWRGSVGAFYEFEGFGGSAALEQGPGVLAIVERRSHSWGFGGWASGQYVVPLTVETSLIDVRLETIASRAGLGLSFFWGPRIALSARAGLGADFVHASPRRGLSGTPVALSPESFSIEGAAQVAFVATLRLGVDVAAFCALPVDMDLQNRHYDVLIHGALTRAIEPWLVRPGVMVGAAWP